MLKRIVELLTDVKFLALFMFALISAIIVGTIFVYSLWLQGQSKLAEFEKLKSDVTALQSREYLDKPGLELRFATERDLLLGAAVHVSESAVTGGAQGWNDAVMCPQGQYAAGVQFEGANQGMKYCVTCFLRAKVLCRPFNQN